MMKDQVDKVIHGKTVSRQAVIVAPHGAIMTVLTAVIRYLDNTAHEHAFAKDHVARCARLFAQQRLRAAGCDRLQRTFSISSTPCTYATLIIPKEAVTGNRDYLLLQPTVAVRGAID
jgi:hypothetical protein